MLSFKDVFMTSSQKEVDSTGSKNDHLTNVDKCCHSMTPDGLFFLVKIYDWEKKLRRRLLSGKKKKAQIKKHNRKNTLENYKCVQNKTLRS